MNYLPRHYSFSSLFVQFSFTNGIFPKNCTIAKIIPIFKKGDRQSPTNYWPVSILTCFSKIFEKLIHTWLTKFWTKHKVLTTTQYGFQAKLSTTHALLDVITSSFENIKDNLFTGLILLDLAKAFDTVSHDFLLSKLDHYGIRGTAKDLLQSFLKRKQFVFANGCKSSIENNYGVVQGSTLGPLLFLIYVNDLPPSVNCIPRLFADDTCLVYSEKNQQRLTEIINADLQKISEWFKANKLTVNPSKSNIIIIPPKLNQLPVTIKTYLKNTLIPQTSATNYLGITIDTDLKFHNHIVLLVHKISRTIGILSKLRQFLPQSALLKIYYALIHSQLMYGLPIWGSTFPSYTNKLKSLQNKAVKTIGGGSSLESPTKFFNKFS